MSGGPWTHSVAAAAALTVAVLTLRLVAAQATDIVARDAWVRESTATRTDERRLRDD